VRVDLPNGFKARPYQQPFMRYFDKGGKRAVWVLHRRGGKDLTALHQTCKQAVRRKGAYWHIFPTAEQGKKAIWEGFTRDGERIMEQVFPRSIRKSPRAFMPSGEMVVELVNGSIWRLMGSDKMEVVGAGPVGVVFSEFALSKPKTWDLIRPMLRENDGWAAFITTPRGNNHAKKLFDIAQADPSWFCKRQTLFDTRAYDPEKTIAEERASGMPEELIAQEYLCDWAAANVGSFYGVSLAALEKRGGIGVPFESETDDIFTSWDLGKADDTAIWWWRPSPTGVDILDHYASHGDDLDHYFGVLKDRAELHGWKYRKHWLPHDARAKTLATKVSVLDQFIEEYGTGGVAVVPAMLLKDGIAATRELLNHPGTRIHPRCSLVAGPKDCDGVEALREYHREWDDEKKCFRDNPVHDWSSHTADGIRYVATVAKLSELLTRKPPPKTVPIKTIRRTLDEAIDEHEAHQGQHRRL
jgi:phage terminase large subunit